MLEEPSWRVVHEAVSVMSPDTTDRLYFGDPFLAFTLALTLAGLRFSFV